MKKQFSYNQSRYFYYSWQKFMVLWACLSLPLCVAMAINGTALLGAYIAVVCFMGFLVVLIYIGRNIAWKKSKIIIDGNRIDLCHLADTYDPEIELGQKRITQTYTVVRPTSIEIKKRSVVIKGDVIYTETRYEYGKHTRREKRLSNFKIPPYFSDWDVLLKELESITGGY